MEVYVSYSRSDGRYGIKKVNNFRKEEYLPEEGVFKRKLDADIRCCEHMGLKPKAEYREFGMIGIRIYQQRLDNFKKSYGIR